MGRYDGEDYPESHYKEKALGRINEERDFLRKLVRKHLPKAYQPFWVLATLGVSSDGCFRYSEAIEALCKLGGLSKPHARRMIRLWSSEDEDLLWDWTDSRDPVRIHGETVHYIEEADTEELVREFGEGAREIQKRAAKRERWYRFSTSGRLMARALWPEDRSDSETTLHWSYG